MIATDGKPLTDEMLDQMVADLRSMGIVPPEMTKKRARERLREFVEKHSVHPNMIN